MNLRQIQIDQCLFGYEDGHRLLATSVPLGSEASALTELSDLAPGTVFGASSGYWTGVPAPAIKRYALMRTWPAPEMPRPGCVWTHALLVEPSVLGELGDLATLAALASRPAGPADRNRYRDPLGLEGGTAAGSAPRDLDVGLVARLLAALYGGEDGPIAAPTHGELDGAVFAVWSQQWPRLRRNLRFQTAVTRDGRTSSGNRLDISLTLGHRNAPARGASVEDGWLSAAATDAAAGTLGPLRRFLWRYGGDVKRQRGSFRPLVEIKLLNDRSTESTGSELLGIVTESFAEPGDAVRLKQDVVDGSLVPTAQLDVLWYVLANGGDAVFPAPSEAGVARLAHLWPTRPDDLLHLAETADTEDPLGRSIFETVTGAVPLENFWILTSSYPRIRRRMVEARPELLLSDGVSALDDAAIASLVGVLQPDATIGAELVGKLLQRDDTGLTDALTDRFPQEVASQVMAAADGGSISVGRSWITGLVRRPAVLLDPLVMGTITRTSLLYELAEMLGWLTPEVAHAGTEPWIAALVDVRSDLSDDRRDTLRAFLVALALASGGDGGRRVLEKFFEAVHDLCLRSRLPWRAKDILSPLLPELGWGRNWDFGLRLRLAVAHAYVTQDYPPESFASLASGKKARSMLADAARDLQGGKPLARALGG